METMIEQVKRLREKIGQAQIARNKLNLDIENMIDELCRKLRDFPQGRQTAERFPPNETPMMPMPPEEWDRPEVGSGEH